MWVGLGLALLVIFNLPRAPFIAWEQGDPIGILKGLKHGAIGFSYMLGWTLLAGGVYQCILGILYWDMDTTEHARWQFALDSGGTARVLWGTGAACLLFGGMTAFYAYRNDHYLWPCGAASTAVALLACWMMWLAFPLYEQVGIDREELGV
jgi:hypothetical protein